MNNLQNNWPEIFKVMKIKERRIVSDWWRLKRQLNAKWDPLTLKDIVGTTGETWVCGLDNSNISVNFLILIVMR